jgi:hypothetical protein
VREFVRVCTFVCLCVPLRAGAVRWREGPARHGAPQPEGSGTWASRKMLAGCTAGRTGVHAKPALFPSESHAQQDNRARVRLSAGGDVAGVSAVPVQMWAGVSAVPVQM